MVFIPLTFVMLFIILAVLAVRSPKARTDKEVGLTPKFEEVCGGRIGMMNYTWPLVRHSIYDDFIVIKCLGGCHTIPRNSLKVEKGDGVYPMACFINRQSISGKNYESGLVQKVWF